MPQINIDFQTYWPSPLICVNYVHLISKGKGGDPLDPVTVRKILQAIETPMNPPSQEDLTHEA